MAISLERIKALIQCGGIVVIFLGSIVVRLMPGPRFVCIARDAVPYSMEVKPVKASIR